MSKAKPKSEKSQKFKYRVTYKDGTAIEEELTLRQRSDLKKRDDWSKVKSVRGLGKVKEDGEAGPAGGATLGTVVGTSPTNFGNNPQNGNSDQRKGSGIYLGSNGQRELTDDEKKMLNITDDLADSEEGIKVVSYEDFKAKSVKESYAPVDKVNVAVTMIFGDFSTEAKEAVKKLPIIDGMVEIKGISEALSGKYKEGQIRKVIDAISAK